MQHTKSKVWTIYIRYGGLSVAPKGCVEGSTKEIARRRAAREFDVAVDKISLVPGCKVHGRG